MKILDVCTSSEVKTFFFFFDDVVMCGNLYQEKVTQMLPHLDGKSFDLFYDKCAENYGMILSAANYTIIKDSSHEEFQKGGHHGDETIPASSATIDPRNLSESLRQIDRAFEKSFL